MEQIDLCRMCELHSLSLAPSASVRLLPSCHENEGDLEQCLGKTMD